MKIPKSIRVITQVYEIKWDREIDCMGLCQFTPPVIKLHPDIKKSQNAVLRTLWHEIGHAFAYESGLSQIIHGQAEEQFVEVLSALIVDLTGGRLKSK